MRPADLRAFVARSRSLWLARGGVQEFGARVVLGRADGQQQQRLERVRAGDDDARCFLFAGSRLLARYDALYDANLASCDRFPSTLVLGLGPCFTSGLGILRGGGDDNSNNDGGEDGQGAAAGAGSSSSRSSHRRRAAAAIEAEMAADAAPDCAVLVVLLDPRACRGACPRGLAPCFLYRVPGGTPVMVRHGSVLLFPPATPRQRRAEALARARVEPSGSGDDEDRLWELRFYVSTRVREMCASLGSRGVHVEMAASLGQGR